MDHSQSRTAVVVDDELITRLDFSGMLTDMGFHVVGEASDGFDAVELCRLHRPDLVLMDISMPIFNGLSAAETILGEGLSSAVVILTAFSDPDTVRKASELGVKGYLIKPVEPNALYAAVTVALEQAARERKLIAEKEQFKNSLQEIKLIERAKRALSKTEHIGESEAYRKIQKLSMDKRCSMKQIAESILQNLDSNLDVRRAKELLTARGMSEKQAYRKITALAEAHDTPLEEAARRILQHDGIL
ncbi:MAG: response regulator [Clostridiales bacterium]|nr:response regulator [Clostridiales bacterium]